MQTQPTVQSLEAELKLLEAEITDVKDRLLVLEERTGAHESRLEDLEEWKDKVDDKQDKG